MFLDEIYSKTSSYLAIKIDNDESLQLQEVELLPLLVTVSLQQKLVYVVVPILLLKQNDDTVDASKQVVG